MPYLMEKLHIYINATNDTLNLKGQIIGNGITNWRYDGFPAYYEMAYHHGLIDDELFDFGREFCNFSYFEFNQDD